MAIPILTTRTIRDRRFNMTRREFFLSIFTGLILGCIFSACFIGGVQRGLDYRDAVTGIDSKAIIQGVLQ